MNYWQRWIGDWKRKTAHLTAEEKGIYGELLDHVYATEAPLPHDLMQCIRIACASSDSEREAVKRILDQFFPGTPEAGRMNARAAEEIAARRNFVAGKAAAARVRWQAAENPPAPRKRINGAPKADPLAGFEAFYSAYPRKVGRAAAERAWAKLKPDEALQAQMLAALRQQDASDAWAREGGQFIPHPSTWLNGRRWQDALTIEAPK